MTGQVVELLTTGIRYAISKHNFDPSRHRLVRDLGPGETVLSYQPQQPQPVSSTVAQARAQKSEQKAG